ncbi:hypothetical protein I7I51_01139 [Histoplasma capsulatum]|uniref:Uncharacterized protein n=1 Tax=Ajellomyces capsulatus TaxID=5037 RepID=A0A8A1MIZ1_AJECA|nr:hypothetical protein I7I51_01139 [Histoplasma capsulatum]
MSWSLLTGTFMISTPLPQWTLESFEPLSPHRKRSLYSEESLKIFISPAISSWAVKAPTAYPWMRSSHVPVMGMFLSLINISIEPKYVMFEEFGPSFLATNPHSPSRTSYHPAQHEARDWGYGLTSTIKPMPQEHSDIRLGAGVFQPFARLSLLLVQAVDEPAHLDKLSYSSDGALRSFFDEIRGASKFHVYHGADSRTSRTVEADSKRCASWRNYVPASRLYITKTDLYGGNPESSPSCARAHCVPYRVRRAEK